MQINTWQKAPGQWRMSVESEAMAHSLACCLIMLGFRVKILQATCTPTFELDILETDENKKNQRLLRFYAS